MGVKGSDNNKSVKDYFVGLDIGTSSVGWAVTNREYELLRAKGHRMWGSRLFPEGQTAEERRVKRSARRRLERRNDRLAILEELFAEEIAKMDPSFYQRLHESQYKREHKNTSGKYFLFNGPDYTDKDYHKEYPTIFHLRKTLMESEPKDIRLLFLAVHHIIKYRGNFLYEGESLNTSGDIAAVLEKVLAASEFSMLKAAFKHVDLVSILTSQGHTRSDMAKAVAAAVENKDYKRQAKAFVSLTLGLKVTLADLFNEVEYKELDISVKYITFKEKEYWEERENYESVLGESIFALDGCKTLYDALILSKIKPDGRFLSEAKVAAYETHKAHLNLLKHILKPYKELYDQAFNIEKDKLNNYIAYIGKSGAGKSCERDEFYAFLKKILDKIPRNHRSISKHEQIIQLMEIDSFMPLLRVRENGVIPYQIHQEELEKILQNACEKYEFLQRKDEHGITVREKIVKLMTFRIPYYVGPLNPAHKDSKRGFAWVVRKSPGKVYPWNFEDKVDIGATATAFIENMTNKCTYLIGEDVLPRYSLAYSRFLLLNEVNNLRFNGKPFPYEIKEKFIQECFEMSNKKMTESRIKAFLKRTGAVTGNIVLTGIDVDIKSNLSSYRDMVRILGEDFDYEIAERIIRYITLFGDEKKILRDTLEQEFGTVLTKAQRDKLTHLKYREWGRLSEAFLNGIKGIAGDGPECSILECMERKPLILMEVLSSHNTFLAQIEAFNNERTTPIDELNYELVDELKISPSVKRSVWQTLRVLQEIAGLRGGVPQKIFVEVARTNLADKQRTISRKERLLQLYKNIEDASRDWRNELKQRSVGEFQSKKLYLYYMQLGRCMYSGESIDLAELFTDKYDIDHIYPKSVTKDDSLDNLVLVKKIKNSEKTDRYPINPKTQKNRAGLWKTLVELNLISQRKYDRLIRTTELTDNELADFVSRQLVETTQSVKSVTTLLKRLYPHTTICYVKSENVAAFRQKIDYIKLRNLNSHHHAKDAYLNIVVGNVYYEKFTNNPRNYIKQARKRLQEEALAGSHNAQSDKYRRSLYNLTKMFDYPLRVKGREIWNPKTSFFIVNKMMLNNDVQVTKKLIEQKGALFDATIYKADRAKDEIYVPLKTNDPVLNDVEQYGGYTSVTNAFYSIFKLNKSQENDFDIQIVPIPLLKINQFKADEDLIDYMMSILDRTKYNSVEVLYKKLCIGALIRVNGFLYYVGGKTGNQICLDSAIDVLLDKETVRKLKHIETYLARFKENNQYLPHPSYVNNKFNIDVYKALVAKMKSVPFVKMKLNRAEELGKNKTVNNFKKMNIIDQCMLLMEMLNLLTNKKTTYDLKSVGITASRCKLNMKITNLDEFVIINKSITGLYQQEHVIISQ